MIEHEAVITDEYAREIVDDLDAFMILLELESQNLKWEEEATLKSIEWAIRLRSRQAQARDEDGKVALYERCFSDAAQDCDWLLSAEDWIFPEEPRSKRSREKSWQCTHFLLAELLHIEDEPTERGVKGLLDEWFTEHGPVSADVNAKTVNACVKRRLFFVKRLMESRPNEAEHQTEYSLLLSLHRVLNDLIDSGVYRSDDFYPPPPPF